MGVSLIIFGISILGLALLWLRRAPDVALLNEEELLFIKNTRPSFTRHTFGWLTDILHKRWFISFRPLVFRVLMRVVSFFQQLFMSIAHACTRLASKLRARSAVVPKPSQYWQEIYSWKSMGRARLKGLRTPYRKMNRQRDIREIITIDTAPKSGVVSKSSQGSQNEQEIESI